MPDVPEGDRVAQKRATAIAAVGEVDDGMRVGLGTGSTVAFAIPALAERAARGLRVTTVATSIATERAAVAAGLTVVPFDTLSRVDIAIDGADEIDRRLRAIKGGGAAAGGGRDLVELPAGVGGVARHGFTVLSARRLARGAHRRRRRHSRGRTARLRSDQADRVGYPRSMLTRAFPGAQLHLTSHWP